MDYYSYSPIGEHLQVTGLKNFNLPDILENGQAFRWVPDEAGIYHGVALGRYLRLEQKNDTLLLYNTTPTEFENIWKNYFDLTRDYSNIKERLSTNKVMVAAIAYAPGNRVLQQDPWETMCCFILSQNTNIKRIQSMVERFCQALGTPLKGGYYAFPTPEQLAKATLADLEPVRAGFRAKYLLHAAELVSRGVVELTLPYTLPLEEARQHLMQINGVGPKVSDCVLLFGYSRLECFPVDVWIQRVLATLFPKGFPKKFGDIAGLAQQYLFHYARNNPALFPEKQ